MFSRYVFHFLMAMLALGLVTACGFAEQTETTPDEASAIQPAAVPPPTDDLLALRANAWQWIGLDNGGGVQVVEDPANYRLAFNKDATLAAAADCINAAGSYQLNEIGDNALTIEIGPVTAAACPDGSRGEEFLGLLPGAQALRFEDGKLLIVVAGETGFITMVFAPTDQAVEIPQTAVTVTTAALAAALDNEDAAQPLDLGEAVLRQDWVSNEEFKNLPVRLNGLIAAPPTGENLPLAIIIHGSHGAGCLSPDGINERWPCPERENPHYTGFAYLLAALAERGYVAISINANPGYVMAYGGAAPNDRLPVLLDLYIEQIAAAANGADVGLPVDLAGRVDLSRIVALGHSAGGEALAQIVNGRAGRTTPEEVAAGFGPIDTAILLAPSRTQALEIEAATPFAVILPACDRDVSGLDGQHYYEKANGQSEREVLSASVYLPQANHNRFNSGLTDETLGRASSIFEGALLPAAEAQAFLTGYVPGFFDAALDKSIEEVATLGLDPAQAAPAVLFGESVLTSLSLPASQRLQLPLDGEGATGALTAVFCKEGYGIPGEAMEACRREAYNQPGTPEMAALSWDGTGGSYEIAVPAGSHDLSGYTALHLRAVVDPLSSLNEIEQSQSFSVRLIDGAGQAASVVLSGEPALAFPVGAKGSHPTTGDTTWDNHIIISSVRVPLASFAGVDLTDLRSVVLEFDETPSGAIYLTDLEFLEKDVSDMTQSTTTMSDTDKPAYVTDLEASYGPPSAEGFGSAVFYERLAGNADLEAAAQKYYRHFVGDLWERWGEAKWISPWQKACARPSGATHDVVAELRGIADPQARVSVPMILDEVEDADKAREALASAFDAPEVSDLGVYTIGDGEQMSGLIVAGHRANGEATFLLFLLD